MGRIRDWELWNARAGIRGNNNPSSERELPSYAKTDHLPAQIFTQQESTSAQRLRVVNKILEMAEVCG